MNKPRICEILGIEPDKVFRVENDLDDLEYLITKTGKVVLNQNKHEMIDPYTLCALINGETRIIPVKRWSEQMIEYAKNIRQLFPDAYFVKYSNDGKYVTISDYYSKVIANIYNNPVLLSPLGFRQLKSGEFYRLDDIIGGAE